MSGRWRVLLVVLLWGCGETGSVDDAGSTVPVGPTAGWQAHVVTVDIEVDPDAWEALHADPTADIEVDATITVDGTAAPCTISLHGGFTKGLPKKSYRVVYPDAANVEVDLFGAGAERQRRFVLLSSWTDPTFLRNKIVMDLLREAGALSPRVAFADVRVDGSPLGLYALVERIDKPYLKRQGLDPDGNLYKAEDSAANWRAKANPMAGFEPKYGSDPQGADLAELLDVVTNTAATYDAFVEQVEPLLDVDEFLVWQRIHTFALNTDTFTKNYYLYHDPSAEPGTPEGRFHIISWDAEATFGLDDQGDPVDPTTGDWHGTDTLSPRLLSIAEYRTRYVTEYLEALDGPLRADVLQDRIEALATVIAPLARADLQRWARSVDFDQAVGVLLSVVQTRTTTMRALLMAQDAWR